MTAEIKVKLDAYIRVKPTQQNKFDIVIIHHLN